MAAHEQHQRAAKVCGQKRHRDRGDDAPNDQGVPLPLPDVAEEANGVMAEVFELARAERKAMGVEELDAEFDERQEEEQVDGRGGVDADLRGDLVEPEDPCQQKGEDGREADGRVDAEHEAEGEAPREASRGDAAAELAQQRPKNLAPQELADWAGEKHTGLDASEGG